MAVGPARQPRGFFLEPTIFTDVDKRSRLAQEDAFGPVGVVTTFADDDAVRLANEPDYGLAGAIYSADSGSVYEMATRLRTGGGQDQRRQLRHERQNIVSVVGSGRGIGVEHGELGTFEYTHAQTISFNAD